MSKEAINQNDKYEHDKLISASKFGPALAHQEFLIPPHSWFCCAAAHSGDCSLRCMVPTKLALHKTHVLLGEHDDLHVDMMTCWREPLALALDDMI